MTRFQKRATEQSRRPAIQRRVEIAAALLIPALVVGIPYLTNYSHSRPTSVSTGARPSSPGPTDATTVPGAAVVLGESVEIAVPAVDDVPLKVDSTFWDVSSLLDGGLVAPAAPVAPVTPGPGTTSTTGQPITPAGPGPTSPLSTTTPTTRPATRTASVPRPPANLVLGFGSSSLTASWQAASTNTDGTAFVDFKTYEITFTAGGLSAAYETTSPSIIYTIGQNQSDFGAPQAELTVTVRVVADSGTRSGPLAGVATNEVPDTPTAPPLLTSDSAHVTVTVPDQGPVYDLAGFDIYHSESATGPFVKIASTVGYDSFIHDVFTGTTHPYLYKVRDVFAQVSPGFSPTATATAI